jgi:hypothetical protein
VKVFNRQEVGGVLIEPCPPGGAPALGAMPITAGAIGDRPMATFIALMDVAAEGGSSAERNIPERSFLLSAERISKPSQISRTVEAKNIGQLQRWRRHEAGIGSTE